MKKILISLFLFLSYLVCAQKSTGINNTAPNSKAALDIKSSAGFKQGFLMPRLSTADTLNIGVSLGQDRGLMFFDTLIGDVRFWTGAKWAGGGGGSNAWNIGGNTVPTTSNSYLGTLNAQNLSFITNSQVRMTIDNANGYIGIRGAPYSNAIFTVYDNAGNEALQVDNYGAKLGDVGGNSFTNYLYVDFESAGNFQFMNGKVGIGTISPTSPLQIYDASLTDLLKVGNGNGMLKMSVGSLANTIYSSTYNGSGGRDLLLTSGDATNGITLKTSGFVGIGTASPTNAKLHVDDASGAGVTLGRFGGNFALYMVASYPTIGFNAYYNAAWKYGTTGFGGYLGMDPSTGRIMIGNTSTSGTADATGTIVDRVSITSTGYVGIGTSAPTQALDVAGGIRTTGGFYFSGISAVSGSAQYFFGVSGSYIGCNDHFIPDYVNSQDLGTAGYRWRTLYTTNTVNVSDRRLKENIRLLSYGLPEIMALKPVTYQFKDDKEKKTSLGLIAQEVYPIIPEIVTIGTDSLHTLGLNYTSLIPILIKAIQQQQQTIDSQAVGLKELEKLKIQHTKTEAELDRLKAAFVQLEERVNGKASLK